MGFQKYLDSNPNSETLSWENDWAESAWNAAIDEAIKKANRKLRGITSECNGYNRCSTEIVKELRKLKT